MNKYESVILVNPNLNEEELEKEKNFIFDLVKENGGTLLHEEEYAFVLKKTAYEVQKHKRAYYLVFQFEANPEFIEELQRNYRIRENIIKFLVLKLEKQDRIITKFDEDSKENFVRRDYRSSRRHEVKETEETQETEKVEKSEETTEVKSESKSDEE